MNRVDISAEEVPLPAWSPMVNDYILKVLDRLEKDAWDLSVLFCNNAYIRSLNERFRNIDEPTDVLSFELGTNYHDETSGETRFLSGDIIVSLETLEENAEYFKVSRDEELRRLLIHGILHLDGMDHQTNEGVEPMLKLQEQILTELSGEAIF
ncbi:rRNA maturation RNase YbeY [Treponema primitia]|uniref:rRNA maturation RNase YbeY n=1 Tax=Treponema primitia TaxID=88058 RepID=UPI0002554E7A|nr:rRNA maturation RNase YbeY [Treponema primitia]